MRVIERNRHSGDTFRKWRQAGSVALVCAAWWGAFGCGRTAVDALESDAGPAAGASHSAGSGSLASKGGAGAGGGAGAASAIPAAGMAGLAGTGDGTAGAVSAGAGGANAGAGGEGGAQCRANECPAWVQVGGALPPAYSYVIAAAASEVGTVYTGNDSYGSVYKTTTSGASWFPASSGIDGDGVRALAVDPFDGDYVWAANLSGLYRSSNAGASWGKVNVASNFPQVQWITTDPVVRGRVYVLLNPGSQVNPAWSAAYVSDDRGQSWRRLGTPANFRANTLDVDTSDPMHLFLGTYGQGVLESHDTGTSFQPLTGPGTTSFPDALVSTGNTLFAYSRTIAGRLHRSDNQGSTWATTLLTLPNNVFAFAVSVLPSPTFATDNVVYLGTRTATGPAVSFEQSLDGALSFTPRGNGDFATVSMTWDKAHQGWLWAVGARTVSSVQSEQLYLSKDTGLSWSAVPLPMQGNYSEVEAALTPNGEVLYVTVGGQGVLRSDDAGSTWQLVGAPPGDILIRLTVDPTDAQTLYAVTGPNGPPASPGERGLFKSRDGGASWSHADRGLPPGTITSLLIEPNNPRIVYAGVAHGGLYRTSSGGE